jgi:hypothetical protein
MEHIVSNLMPASPGETSGLLIHEQFPARERCPFGALAVQGEASIAEPAEATTIGLMPQEAVTQEEPKTYEGIMATYMMRAITSPLVRRTVEHIEAKGTGYCAAVREVKHAMILVCDPSLTLEPTFGLPDEIQKSEEYMRLFEPGRLEKSPARLAAHGLAVFLPDFEFDEKLVKDTYEEMVGGQLGDRRITLQ